MKLTIRPSLSIYLAGGNAGLFPPNSSKAELPLGKLGFMSDETDFRCNALLSARAQKSRLHGLTVCGTQMGEHRWPVPKANFPS